MEGNSIVVSAKKTTERVTVDASIITGINGFRCFSRVLGLFKANKLEMRN